MLISSFCYLKKQKVNCIRASFDVSMTCETKFNDPPLDHSSIDRTNIVCKITYVAHSKEEQMCFSYSHVIIIILKSSIIYALFFIINHGFFK